MHPQLLQDAIAVGLRLHVDEVGDDDAAHVAQADLSGELTRRLHIRAEDGLFGILLAGVAP
jgi:hypothetical protein